MNALKETKKKHLLAILKYLYLHNSSTMNELVENLQLSQPSIRNMVRILQEKQLIQEIGNDFSSGGRCPTRFALNEIFNSMSLYSSGQSHLSSKKF